MNASNFRLQSVRAAIIRLATATTTSCRGAGWQRRSGTRELTDVIAVLVSARVSRGRVASNTRRIHSTSLSCSWDATAVSCRFGIVVENENERAGPRSRRPSRGPSDSNSSRSRGSHRHMNMAPQASCHVAEVKKRLEWVVTIGQLMQVRALLFWK